MWVWEIHSVFCFVLPFIFVEEIALGLTNALILHFHLVKFCFPYWSYEKGKKNSCLLYSLQLFVNLRLYQSFSMVLYLLLLRNHPLLLKFLNSSLQRNLFKDLKIHLTCPSESFKFISFALIQAFPSHGGNASWGSVSGIWPAHLGKF